VLRQNFKKKAPAVIDAMAITTNRNPSIMSLFALPNQALKQDDHRNRGNREPQTIEVHIREHDQIHKDQKIRDREAGKAEPAPQEKPLLDPDVAPEQQQGTEQGR
jgi:hypothetical protein